MNNGRLGERIASRAHREGRAAYKLGILRSDNPYDAGAERDSDEWLRREGWQAGWTFAWYKAGCR